MKANLFAIATTSTLGLSLGLLACTHDVPGAAVIDTSESALGASNICPPSNAVGIVGIGDGCSTGIAGTIFPDIGIFRGTFTPACDAHDKCYSTLGTTYGECDGNFLSTMQSACRSKFNPFFFPFEFAACNATATNYYAAVKGWGAAQDPLPGIQTDALRRSRLMQTSVDADVCGTTPAATTLYSSNLISQIDTTFLTYANRSPTVYEFFDAVNAGNIVADRAGWEFILRSKAGNAAYISPPAIGFTSATNDSSITLTANPLLSGVSYLWKANSVSSAATASSFPLTNPKYDRTWMISGFVKATNPAGQRNMQVISVPVHESGWCATAPGPNVNCY